MESEELIQGLYGSQITRERMVAYCQYHRAGLTVKTMKGHECLKKQCDSLQKCKEHDFWRQHEQKREWRKKKKQLIEMQNV